MRSMTGYSKLNYENNDFRISMEIKGVNNKNLSTKIRLPYNLNSLESFIRVKIAQEIRRGSIDLRIEFEDKKESLQEIKYDENLAKSGMKILEKMEDDFQDKFSNKMDFLIRTFGVISKKDVEIVEDAYKKLLEENLDELLDRFISTKIDEGNRLKLFFQEQLLKLRKNLEEIKKLKLEVGVNYKNKLLSNVKKLNDDIEIKEEDILKEILIYSDRVDITEEVSRLESHFNQLDIEFEADKNQGKKIEFIFQEVFRELNTMGVKANMYDISKLVVESKNELEKMREQIMNIE